MTDKLHELIERLRTERTNSVVAGLCCIKREVLDEAATALQSYAARVEELEAIVREFADSPAYGASAGELYCKMTMRRGLIEQARAALLKQLSGLDASHDPTHQ